MKKFLCIFVAICVIFSMFCLTGCEEITTEANRVNHNVRIQADNFNITRQITVFNLRTDTVLFQMTGRMSISNNTHEELVVTCEIQPGIYKQHMIRLPEEVSYVVEDVSGAYADPYHYELNILPVLIPVTITTID